MPATCKLWTILSNHLKYRIAVDGELFQDACTRLIVHFWDAPRNDIVKEKILESFIIRNRFNRVILEHHPVTLMKNWQHCGESAVETFETWEPYKQVAAGKTGVRSAIQVAQVIRILYRHEISDEGFHTDNLPIPLNLDEHVESVNDLNSVEYPNWIIENWPQEDEMEGEGRHDKQDQSSATPEGGRDKSQFNPHYPTETSANLLPKWAGSDDCAHVTSQGKEVHLGVESISDPSWSDSKYGTHSLGAALQNPDKWTCFLNCVLQCLVHTVPFVLKLLKADHPDPCIRACNGFCCYCAVKKQIINSLRFSGSVLNPADLVNSLHLILPDFQRGMHHDAHEFLRFLLAKLDDASVPAGSSSSSMEDSIVNQVFRGSLKSKLHCPRCNHFSEKLEAFLDISLEVTGVDSIEDAMLSYTKLETMEDLFCNGCKSTMNKSVKLHETPQILVIHLKRFQTSGDIISKIDDMVEHQIQLDINPFMASPDSEPQIYNLYAIVEHVGTPSSGHYFSFIRSSQATWYLFNDDKVSEVSEADVLRSKPYLLFYVKNGSSPFKEKDLLL